MDVNLGTIGGNSYQPALTIYQHVKSDVESNLSRFLAISGNSDVVQNAKRAGIPALEKNDIQIIKMIKESKL